MPVVSELIRIEDDGTVSFGDYDLKTKSKLQDFEYKGDLYKVKTYDEITKLERNGMFVYESVPGTAVNHFSVNDTEMEFIVEGAEDAQITVQLEDDSEYEVFIDDIGVGTMKTNVSGKLAVSVEFNEGQAAKVKIVKK
ncbi:MAG: endosialidase [Clostridium sp.]